MSASRVPSRYPTARPSRSATAPEAPSFAHERGHLAARLGRILEALRQQRLGLAVAPVRAASSSPGGVEVLVGERDDLEHRRRPSPVLAAVACGHVRRPLAGQLVSECGVAVTTCAAVFAAPEMTTAAGINPSPRALDASPLLRALAA